MQYYTFVGLILWISTRGESKVSEKEYSLMPALFHMDDFDRCLMLGEKTLYCTLTVQLAPAKYKYSKVWRIIEEVISYKKNFRHDRLRHSICVPSHCPNIGENAYSYVNNTDYLRRVISQCYTEKYKDLGLISEVVQISCETHKSRYEIDYWDIIVGLCLFALIALLAFASFYEGLARYKPKEEYDKIVNSKWGKWIACFSLPKNWDRLKTINTSSDTNALKVVNGMRFHTIILVIIAHACMVSFATYSSNPQFEERMTNEVLNMIFINGNYSMQTFLMISGLLLSYHFFLAMEKMKNFKVSYLALAFVNRYIRLTTCLIVMIAINATWLRHLNRGPLWDKVVGDEFRNCRKNWWINLLYINNYYNVQNMCLLQSWYLAADTQLFLISLIILGVVWKYKKYKMTIFCTCVVVGMMIPAVTTYVYNFDILIREYPEDLYNTLLNVPEWTILLIQGHMNIGSYSIGLIAGYFIYKTKGKKIVIKKRFLVLWWIVVWGLPLGIIFLGVPIYDDNFVPTRVGAALYQGVARNIFAMGVCVGILGVHHNIGWFLRDAILWQPFQVLGRLTYCIFLVHVAFIRVKLGQARVINYLSPFSFFIQSIADLIASMIFALMLCLFVEMPTSALQKLMMPRLHGNKDGTLISDHSNNVNKSSIDGSDVTKV